MSNRAWAVVVTEQNFPAILSEVGGHFDRDFLQRWFAEEGSGYFVRDKTSPLDCCLFSDSEFSQLYFFAQGNEDALFREVVRQE